MVPCVYVAIRVAQTARGLVLLCSSFFALGSVTRFAAAQGVEWDKNVGPVAIQKSDRRPNPFGNARKPQAGMKRHDVAY